MKSGLSYAKELTMDVNISMDEASLKDNIINYLKDKNLIFVIGTLTSINGQPAADVFFKEIKTSENLKNFKRLKTLKNYLNEPGGYIYENLDKLVIFLQDDPKQISFMVSNYIIPLINQKYDLKNNEAKFVKNDMKLESKPVKTHNKNHTRDRFSKTGKTNFKMLFLGVIFSAFIVFILLYLFLNGR